MKKIRVMHILKSSHFSGAENMVCQIFDMVRKNPSIDMVYCSPDGPIRETLEEKGIPFLPLSSFSLKSIRCAIESFKPTIIHAHDMHASVYAAACSRSIPLVSQIHNNAFDARVVSKKTLLFTIASLKIRYIIWVSQSAKDGFKFARLVSSKSSVMYNVIDRNELLKKCVAGNCELETPIVYVGRLTEPKNPKRLIEVIEMITCKAPNVKVSIIGTGDMDAAVKELVRQKGIEENVVFYGFLKNPYPILNKAKVMIMTSLWEGTPMCALEAMALGVPIVSTPTDGLKELVKEGVTGFLSDNSSVLAQRCIDIVVDSSLYDRLHNATIQMADELLDTQTYTNKLLKVYSICLKDNKK